MSIFKARHDSVNIFKSGDIVRVNGHWFLVLPNKIQQLEIKPIKTDN